MAVTPEHLRNASFAVPRLPLFAILGFTLFGVGGSVFLAYTAFNHGGIERAATPSSEAPVYAARAVPFDGRGETPAERAAAISRALTATQADVRRADSIELESSAAKSEQTLLTESNRELSGFSGFANFVAANSYLAITGASFGFGAQNTPSGFVAPDAETFTSAPVPEVSTWMCGGALFVLVAARGAHARWHRKRRRD
jgi:hypothetical protein